MENTSVARKNEIRCRDDRPVQERGEAGNNIGNKHKDKESWGNKGKGEEGWMNDGEGAGVKESNGKETEARRDRKECER